MKPTKRGDSWQLSITHKGERFRRQFPTKEEALKWGLDTKKALREGRSVELGPRSQTTAGFRPRTVGELMDYMKEHRWASTRGAAAALVNAEHMKRELGAGTKLASLTSHTFNVLASRLRGEGYAQGSINNKLSAVRVAIKYAVKEGWLDAAPEIPFAKLQNTRLRRLDADEEALVLGYFGASDPEMHDLVVVALDMGFRMGELLSMSPRDIGPEMVSVYGTKNNQPRSVPMTARAKAVLTRRRKRNRVFDLDQDQVTYRWQKMRAAIGLGSDEEFVPHALRHTYCSRLADLNVMPQVIQELAGHLSIQTTFRYIHLSPGSLAAAVASLEAHPDTLKCGEPQ